MQKVFSRVIFLTTLMLTLSFFVSISNSAFAVSTTKKEKGDSRVTIKIYDKTGKLTPIKISDSRVKLYSKSGKLIDTKKTSKNGVANFKDINVGNYQAKCSVDGYVNLKKPDKTSYQTGLFKIKNNKRTDVSCQLRQK